MIRIPRWFALALVLCACSTSSETTTTTVASEAAAPAVVVGALEYRFVPEILSIDLPAVVELRNDGGLEHSWTVLAEPVNEETEIGSATVLAEARVDVGQSASVDISDLEPGTYQVVCAIPSHFSLGMVGELRVRGG